MKIDKLVKIMEKLRDPNNGCPWDKKQTMESIIPHTIEEAYEVAEQIYNKNYNELKEELGDSGSVSISNSFREKKIQLLRCC